MLVRPHRPDDMTGTTLNGDGSNLATTGPESPLEPDVSDRLSLHDAAQPRRSQTDRSDPLGRFETAVLYRNHLSHFVRLPEDAWLTVELSWVRTVIDLALE